MKFKDFILKEAPMPPMGGPGGISAPGALPGGPMGGPPGMGAPPMGPPPMGGMGGPPPGLGGPPGMGGMGGQQPQQQAMPLNPTNVWEALEKELGMSDEKGGQKEQPKTEDKPPETKHLIGSKG